MGRTPRVTRCRVAPGPFDRLALGPQVLHFLSDFVYPLRGQFIVLAFMVDHFAVVEAVAQHIPYAGLSKGPPIYGPEPLGVEPFSHITVGIVTGGVVPEEGKEDRHRVGVGDLSSPLRPESIS